MNISFRLLLTSACAVTLMIGVSTIHAKDEKPKTIKMDEVEFNILEEDGRFLKGLPAEMQSRASAGAWSDSEVGPTIFQKGLWYFSPVFNAPITPPGAAKISYLTWQWSVVNYRSDLITYICNSALTGCINVRFLGSGATTAFNGWSASTQFVMAFAVPGSGTISPFIFGQSNTINVSWSM